MAQYTLVRTPIPITPTTPSAPPRTPVSAPAYSGIIIDRTKGVYTTPVVQTANSISTAITIESDSSCVAFMQTEKPVTGDFMIFSSKVNYWYTDANLTTKFTTGNKPVGDFERAINGYAGIYTGTFAAYVDYLGVKRVKSFKVKMKFPYDQAGNLQETEYTVWISAESIYGKEAQKQFDVNGNGYGNVVTIPQTGTTGGTAPDTETEADSGKSNYWLIIIGIGIWLLRKK